MYTTLGNFEIDVKASRDDEWNCSAPGAHDNALDMGYLSLNGLKSQFSTHWWSIVVLLWQTNQKSNEYCESWAGGISRRAAQRHDWCRSGYTKVVTLPLLQTDWNWNRNKKETSWWNVRERNYSWNMKFGYSLRSSIGNIYQDPILFLRSLFQ